MYIYVYIKHMNLKRIYSSVGLDYAELPTRTTNAKLRTTLTLYYAPSLQCHKKTEIFNSL